MSLVSYCSDVHAPTEDKGYATKERFYEELERILDQFWKKNLKILLGDFNAKVGREDIFKLCTLKSLSRVQCCHIATFRNILRLLLTGNHTVRLITFYR
jgi:exonuclease III